MSQIVVVGGGHNGLVAGFYLTRAGHDVQVLEANSAIGGACASRTYHCGCTAPLGATHFGMLLPQVRYDMRLFERGLELIAPEPQLFVITSSNAPISYYSDYELTAAEIGRFSLHDALRFKRFSYDLGLARLVLSDAFVDSYSTLGRFASKLEEAQRGLSTRFLFNSLRQTLDFYFESPETKELFLAAAVLYRVSPSTPGTSFSLAYLAQAQAIDSHAWAFVKGGMARLAELLADALQEIGGTIRTDCRVEKAVVRADGNCSGVVLKSSGEFIPCDYLLLATDPRTAARIISHSVFGPIDQAEANGLFVGSAGRLNILARRSIAYGSVTTDLAAMGRSTLVVANCSFGSFEDGYEHARAGRPSKSPYMELFCPSEVGACVTCGRHSVISAYLLHLPYYREGRRASVFAGYEAELLKYLDSLDPGFEAMIDEYDFLTPRELETQLNLPGGHADHGNMELSHLFERRPVSGFGGGRTPLDNVFLCSAGIHPGGLVTGAPGFNTAHMLLEIISSGKSSKVIQKISGGRVRKALTDDLPMIVALEYILFREAPFLFTLDIIRALYALCPEAFLVAECGNEVVGYAVLFALTSRGMTTVVKEASPSIIALGADCLHPRLDGDGAGLYLEVMAASTEAPVPLRATLLRHLLRCIRKLHLPTFTYPYTSRGYELAARLGFTPIDGRDAGPHQVLVLAAK